MTHGTEALSSLVHRGCHVLMVSLAATHISVRFTCWNNDLLPVWKTASHPLLLANLYTGTWMRGGGGIRRSHFVAMTHLKAELWLVRWYQNKHGGRNESNKAFDNKCYLLYEINKFRINNSRVRKVIHGWLFAWPAGSHRLVSWFPGDSPVGSAGPANNPTMDCLITVCKTVLHHTPCCTWAHRMIIFIASTESQIPLVPRPFTALVGLLGRTKITVTFQYIPSAPISAVKVLVPAPLP